MRTRKSPKQYKNNTKQGDASNSNAQSFMPPSSSGAIKMPTLSSKNADGSNNESQLGYARAANSPIQAKTTKDPGEAVEDAASYYVTDANATIRNNTNPATFTKGKIPAGTKVKRLRTFGGGKAAQVEVVKAAAGSATVVGTTYWTTFTNVTSEAAVTDTGDYFVNYSDTFIYDAPGGKKKTTTADGKTTDQKLANDNKTGYTITARCGAFVKLKQGETEKGWIYEGALLTKAKADRKTYMADYKKWLNARFAEVEALTGTDKTNRAEGILSQVEDVSNQISSGTYPAIDKLTKTPTNTAHDYTSFVQPELIATVRKFIVVLETGTDATSTDWNARLGVPQYRPQSDNLTPPEVTCSPTSFAMAAERLGHSRGDAVASIDEKLTGYRRKEYRKMKWKETEYRKQQYLASDAGKAAVAAGQAVVVPETYLPTPTVPADFKPATAMTTSFLKDVAVPTDYTPATAETKSVLDAKWETKGKAFFKSLTGTKNYQKLRANAGGVVGKETELAKTFRDWGQYEDLVYFRAYLDGVSRGEISVGKAQTYLDHLENPSFGKGDTAGKNVESLDFTSKKTITIEDRNKVQATLEAGGSAILSYRHKGMDPKQKAKTHVVTIREVSSTGFVFDDPYGQMNPDYRRTGKVYGDAYKDVGGTRGRSSYNWKNSPSYNTKEKDYAKRNFSAEGGEVLNEKESRGIKSEMTWDMINGSTDLIYYIKLLSR